METVIKSYQVGDRFTSTKVLDGGFDKGGAKISLLEGEEYVVTEALSTFVVAKGYVHIQQEGRFPVDTFAFVEFTFDI